MICTRCQGRNAENVKFCVHCGAPLQASCPICGTVNAANAKFCSNCGNSLAVPSGPVAASVTPGQSILVVKQGASGWVWAISGIFLAGMLVAGLGWMGVLPLRFQQPSTSPTALPTVQADIPAPVSDVSSVEAYCPSSGGVIVYRNAGYECAYDGTDLGFRMRIGDGAQNLNTGAFDNQASAIQIPPGWSVILYEDPDQAGASVCLNSSVANFEEQGDFPQKAIPVNDNASSMEVFADGTCGEDLAAGAKPAPRPKMDWPEPQAGVPGLEPAVAGCNSINPCDCLPDELQGIKTDWRPSKTDTNSAPFNVDPQVFRDRYLEDVRLEGDELVIELKDFGDLFDHLMELGLETQFDTETEYYNQDGKGMDREYLFFDPMCDRSATDPNGVVCVAKLTPEDFEVLARDYDGQIPVGWSTYENGPINSGFCTRTWLEVFGPNAGGGGEPESCRVTQSCPRGYECQIVGGSGEFSSAHVWDCVKIPEVEEEPEPEPEPQKECDPWDSACLGSP